MVSVADKGFTFVLNKWNETSGFSTCLCGLRLYVTHSLAALLLFKALILVFRALELSVSRKLPSLQALCAWIWAVYPVLPLRCKHRSHFKYLWAATFRFLHRWWSLWFVWATYRLPLKWAIVSVSGVSTLQQVFVLGNIHACFTPCYSTPLPLCSSLQMIYSWSTDTLLTVLHK